MKIKFQYPRVLWNTSGGELELNFTGRTVKDLLAELQRTEPELYRSICNETGRLRQHINLFVNSELLDRSQLEKPLASGDVVQVFQAVSGG